MIESGSTFSFSCDVNNDINMKQNLYIVKISNNKTKFAVVIDVITYKR